MQSFSVEGIAMLSVLQGQSICSCEVKMWSSSVFLVTNGADVASADTIYLFSEAVKGVPRL